MKTVFEIAMDVRWGDMDAFNHVNNASYLRYIEEARVAWFRALVPNAWADVDCAPILAAATVNYRRPIGWPERLRITRLHQDHLDTQTEERLQADFDDHERRLLVLRAPDREPHFVAGLVVFGLHDALRTLGDAEVDIAA